MCNYPSKVDFYHLQEDAVKSPSAFHIKLKSSAMFEHIQNKRGPSSIWHTKRRMIVHPKTMKLLRMAVVIKKRASNSFLVQQRSSPDSEIRGQVKVVRMLRVVNYKF